MHYQEFEPAASLAAHVARYWGMAAGMDVPRNHAYTVVPDGCVTIFSQRNAAGEVRGTLVGPRAEPFTIAINPGDRLWGVRFWPDAGGAVLRMNPRRLYGHLVSPLVEPAWAAALARVLGTSSDETAAAGAAKELLEEPVESAKALDPLVRGAVAGLMATNGEMEIAELARGLGISLRQLERRFLRAVGLNPRDLALVQRMRSSLAHLVDPAARTWPEVAADFGYAEEAGLVRDFSELVGPGSSRAADQVRSLLNGRASL
jgi:AraC-like DNA-binding protein